MNYFISDTHFFQQKLLYDQSFSKREFLLLDDLHETLIKNWNKQVKPSDTVYHLGDIAFVAAKKQAYQAVLELLLNLNGHLIFVKGNHDSRNLFKYLAENEKNFVFYDVGVLLKLNHYQLYLTHYPLSLDKNQKILNLHGHLHHKMVHHSNNLNVCVDSLDAEYLTHKPPFGQPFSEQDIFEMAQNKQRDFQKMR